MKQNLIYKSDMGKKLILEQYDKIMKCCKVPYKEYYVNTSYGKTFIMEAGNRENPKAMLFHGSSTNSSMWIGDMEKLSEKYNIFLIDILGEPGKSSEIRHDLKENYYSLWIEELMRRLSIDKSIFIGNSLGGWMTLKFAVNFPNKVEKLVLLATSGVTNSKISFLFKAIFYLSRGEKGVIGMNKLVYGIDDIPDEVIEVSNLVMKNYNPRTGSLPIFNDDELKKLDMPVLFIGGEKDSLLPTNKTVKRLQKLIPDIDAIILKGRGHVIFDVLDDIMNFLK